jgi:outer membrane protein assembly factor BamB
MLLPLVLALVLPDCGRSGCNEASGRILGPPLAAVDGVVYAAEGGALSALNAATGTLVWRHSTSGGVTTPLVAGSAVIAGTGDGTLVGFHVSGGSVAWHSQPVGRPWSGYSPDIPDPVLSGDVIYAAVSPDSIAAWRISDGNLLWQSPPLTVPTEPGYTSGYAPVPEPVLGTDALYFSAGQSVRAVRASDDSLLWSSSAL